MTETINPEDYKVDAKGRHCPISTINPIKLLEDQAVLKIRDYATDLSDQIARFKAHTFDDINTFLDVLREEYNVVKGGQKGNMTFTSFDGCSKVTVQVQDHIDFGPELRIAKELMDECINDWSASSKSEIQAIVNHTFNVDQPGKVNRAGLFSIRNIESEDPRWQQAVQAINDSIRITGSKSYVRFYQRKTAEDKWQSITIDLAAA